MGGMSVRQMPSRWQMDKFKVSPSVSFNPWALATPNFKCSTPQDDLHYYFLLAAIPLTLLTAYINITVGEVRTFTHISTFWL